jgi:membrane protein
MPKPKTFIDKVTTFFTYDLWHIETRELTRWRLFLLRQVQLVSLVLRDFHVDGCMLRASALTYTTLLSIVPLLALMVSVLKGFGVQNVLEPLILDKLAIGSVEVVSTIFRYIENTHFGRLGTLGLIFLVLSVLTLLSNIEKSFNYIWRVKETRSLLRRFSDYFSVVLFSPLFILAAVSMSSSLQSQTLVQHLLETAYIGEAVLLIFKLAPFVAMWAAFVFLYLFMPNTRVRFVSALIGGIFGGTLWQLVQWGYVHFQVGVAKYNAIYGTMAALPIFIVWLYVSWVIVLLGLELTYALQNASTMRQELGDEQINFVSWQRLALTVLLLVGEAFYAGLSPWTKERICAELKLPARKASELLADLVRLGLLAAVQDARGEITAYQPGRAPENLSLHDLLEMLRKDGAECPQGFRLPGRQEIAEVEQRLAEAELECLDGMTLWDLILRKVGKEKPSAEC